MSYQNGKCQGCDAYGEVDDINLCEDCGDKLEKADNEEGSAEYWAEYKKERRSKKLRNHEFAKKILAEKGIVYKMLNESCSHFRIGDFDFWGTTGLFWNRVTKEKGRGIFELIGKINEQKQKKE